MSKQEGPLSRISRLLGLSDLASIAAIKRIDERPVSLNPEAFFKMAPAPELMSDTGIHALELWKDGPTLPSTIDLTRRAYDIDIEYDSMRPVGERWRAIDLNTFDGGPDAPGCFQGYGASAKEARLALLDLFAAFDERPKPRISRVIHHSTATDPAEYSDEKERDPDDWDFDDGLSDLDDPR